MQCHENTRSLAYRLAELEGISVTFDTFFHEAVLQLDRPVQPVIDALSQQNILAGFDLSAAYPELGHALLVCATDARTAEDMDLFVATMTAVIGQSEAA